MSDSEEEDEEDSEKQLHEQIQEETKQKEEQLKKAKQQTQQSTLTGFIQTQVLEKMSKAVESATKTYQQEIKVDKVKGMFASAFTKVCSKDIDKIMKSL